VSKSDQKAAKQQANEQIARNNANTSATNEQLQSILGNAQSTASSVLPTAVSGYSDIISSGGYDPSVLGRINTANQSLIDTGGFSPESIAATYRRAGQAASSTYETAKDESQRRAAATGGYGDTSAAIMGDLARKGSEAAERAVNNTTATLAPTLQSGMIAGTRGLSDTQQNMAGNRLAAASGITNIYGLNENQINSTVNAILENYRTSGQLNNQDLEILTNLANQPGVFDKIVGTIGTLGGVAAGVLGAVNPKK
jgi:hypothetical protein